ncbi:YbjN domain-containing protein [Isoptericola sp. NPDC056618]|uniref:YbjN domain-containing protein n=1 Tax=Isoptericola sp. NPDC056618 TaxID=3345878 RepID=UPI00369B993A
MTGAHRSGGTARRLLGGVRRAADAVGRAVQDAGARVAARAERAPAGPRGTTPRPLSHARVADDLTRRGYRFRTDDDGDVTGTWDGNRFWFLLLGDHDEILQVRGRWAGTVPEGARLAVLQAVNDWNRERVWPKVYARAEGERLALYTEVSVDFEHGATDEQLAATVSCGLVTSSQFFSTVGAMTPGGPETDGPS